MRERSMMTGNADMLVLKLLGESDMYGYQITEELKKRSENVFEMKAGTLYPLLHGLEEKNLVTTYDTVCDGRTRKYYSITAQGRTVLREKEESWRVFSAAVNRVMTEVAYGY